MAEKEAEHTIYADEKGVRVTTTRLIINNTTYAMATIASVTFDSRKPKNRGKMIILAIIFALIALATWSRAPIVALISTGLAIASAAHAATLESTYVVQVTSASGQSEPLSNLNRDYCAKIVQAVNEAIILRG